VYTDDDMRRPQILLPEDQACFQASRESTKPTLAQQDEIPVASPPPAEIPLGDVARYYRLQKQLRQGQLASDLPGLGNATPLAAPLTPMPPSVSVPVPAAEPPKPTIHRTAPTQEPVLRAAGGLRVARGDSLGRLAKRHLGSGTKWRQLAALNPQLTNPDLIRVGAWIRLPLAPSASQVAKTVRVEKGDTLWKLASAELGSGLAWECIALAVNPI
jgi:nucleoid-associated protein YgaU